MKICVCGWYFRPYFLNALCSLDYETFVIKHREGNTQYLASRLYPNAGLEFGAYRQYVENHWDGRSDVLFMHDDTEIIGEAEIPFAQIETLDERGVDHAYIFPDEIHEFVNGGAHGRALWIRGSILKQLAADFPADMLNPGVNVGIEAQRGIVMFHQRIMQCGPNTGVIAIVPQLRFGHRGRIHDSIFVYRKTGSPIPGGLVHAAE